VAQPLQPQKISSDPSPKLLDGDGKLQNKQIETKTVSELSKDQEIVKNLQVLYSHIVAYQTKSVDEDDLNTLK
jgi:hypothetical protein